MSDTTENVAAGTEGVTEETAEQKEVKLRGLKSSTDDNAYADMPPKQLHGRRQIFTNESEITDENLLEVLNKALVVHNRNRLEEVYLEKYLRGIQPILERIKKYHSEINNKIVVNVANQIVTFKTAEFAGEPIQYISRGSKKSVPKKVEKLNSMMLSEGKQSKDMDLAYKMFTSGVGYRLVLNDKSEEIAKAIENGEYFDEAPFEIYIPDPRNTFVIRLNDVTKKVIAGVTYVFLDETKSQVQYTVYTPNVTYKVAGTATTADKRVGKTVHNFGMVNLIEYPCNSVYMGAFEVVLPLLDAYNSCLSNRLDGIDQFIQAIMVFEGVDITREQFLELKDLGALKLPPAIDGRSSKVYYLNEQLDQSQTQTLVDDIYHTILQIVGMPSQGNANTSDSSNNGAIIMKNGWWNAEARSLETAGMWKEAETTFLKIVLKICEDANVLTGLNVSDVEPKFIRRSYEDLLVKTQSFSTLRTAGCTSLQAFKYSHLSNDPESDAMAFDEYQKQRQSELDQFSGLGATGGGNVTSYPGEETGGEDEQPEEEEESADETGGSDGNYGVCPVCKRRFKKRNNRQVYDRDECRRIAQRSRRGGGFRR